MQYLEPISWCVLFLAAAPMRRSMRKHSASRLSNSLDHRLGRITRCGTHSLHFSCSVLYPSFTLDVSPTDKCGLENDESDVLHYSAWHSLASLLFLLLRPAKVRCGAQRAPVILFQGKYVRRSLWPMGLFMTLKQNVLGFGTKRSVCNDDMRGGFPPARKQCFGRGRGDLPCYSTF